jgi:hypothetical protein
MAMALPAANFVEPRDRGQVAMTRTPISIPGAAQPT